LERLDGSMLVLEHVRNGHGLLARLFSNLHQTSMSLVVSRKARRCLEIPKPRSPTKVPQRLSIAGRFICSTSWGNKRPVGWGTHNLTWGTALDG
jgi:hypothetical protein